VRRDDKLEGLAKSILGGRGESEGNKLDNGVPGPGTYNGNPNWSIPGFKLVPHRDESKEDDDSKEKPSPVGPQKYDIREPFSGKKGRIQIGTSTRDGIKQKFHTPGPDQYDLKDDIENAAKKPRFHMGSKPQARTNKNIDMPGPGEYQYSMDPAHHSSTAQLMGSG